MTNEDGKRKRVSLPVLNAGRATDAPSDDAALDSKGAWVLLGVLATFAFLLPLSIAAGPLFVRLYTSASAGAVARWLVVAAIVTIIAGSCAGATALVTRVGPPLRRRDSLAIGLITGLSMWLLSRHPLGGVILAVTLPASLVGARLARGLRPRSSR